MGLDSEHAEAAELQHENGDEEQDEQRRVCTFLDDCVFDFADPEISKQAVDLDEAEETEHVCLREWKTGQKVGPSVLTKEVFGF